MELLCTGKLTGTWMEKLLLNADQEKSERVNQRQDEWEESHRQNWIGAGRNIEIVTKYACWVWTPSKVQAPSLKAHAERPNIYRRIMK
jgi:hypothetical protein